MMLFLFAKDPSVEDPQQTSSILVRVERLVPLGQRSLADVVATMEARRDPRLVGPITITEVAEVSGLLAIHARLRETVTVGASTFQVVAFGQFGPLDAVMLVIDMKAPASSRQATNAVFTAALASIRIER